MSNGPTQTNDTNTAGTSNSTNNLSGTTSSTGTSDATSQSAGSGTSAGTSSSGAWAPSQPMLLNQLNTIAGAQANSAPNASENAGLTGVEGAAANNATFNPAITMDAGNMLQGGGYGAGNPDVTQGFSTLNSTLTPIANMDANPVDNPQIQGMLSAIQNQVQNSVGGEFSGAGRGGPNTAQSGAANGEFAGTEARNITNQEAPLLLNQYNTNLTNKMNAAQELAAGGVSASGALTASAGGALGAEQAAPGMLSDTLAPYNSLYGAGLTQQEAPLTYAQDVNSTLLPIAQSGSQGATSGDTTNQSAGSSTGNTTQNSTQNIINQMTGNTTGSSQGTSTTQYSPLQTGLGIGTSLLGAWLGSDPRMKKDMAPVGMLFDGTPVHKFKYKGSKTTRIGLMSPQVQARNPAAVKTGKDGMQRVNYDLATRRSAQAPMLAGVM